MVRSVVFSFAVAAIVTGCGPSNESVSGEAAEAGAVSAVDAAVAADAADGAVTEVIALAPENTKIQFVGTHAGDEPNPRKGSFGQFTGKVAMAGDAIHSIEVDIETASLSTEIGKLTDHLKSADFFDVRQHPQARFVSTSIQPGEGQQVTIVGDLTLLGQTKSITFPATVNTADGLQVQSEFSIDRTEFGMDYGVDRVEKPVALTIAIDTQESAAEESDAEESDAEETAAEESDAQ
jgi:polyisoprenoid-binding protein YceI